MTIQDQEASEVIAVWRAQCAAMDAGDAAGIRDCFTTAATLTHMTGYVQPLDEWLDGIRRRQYVYHRLEEHDVEIRSLEADRARLVGHITTGITDDGSGQAWPLTCEQDYVRTEDGWRCANSRVMFGH